jgi:hypothetical protein
MPAGIIPSIVYVMFPEMQMVKIPARLHDQDLIGASYLVRDEVTDWPQLRLAPVGECIPEIEYLNYEGDMAPVALRALARRRYEMRMERKAVRAYRYFRRHRPMER